MDGFIDHCRWMLEKYKGLWVFWNGKDLQTTVGQLIPVPAWLRDQLYSHSPFEAVLWCPGQQPLQASSNWSNVKLILFDSPLLCADSYEDRMNSLHKENSAVVQVAPLTRITSVEHMQQYLMEVGERGGEGLLLRKSLSKYLEPHSFYALGIL